MADTAYVLFKQGLLDGSFGDLATIGDIKLCLVNIAGGHYSPNFNTDEFLSAIASGDRISITAALTSVSVTNGIFNAAATVFSAVPAGPAAGAFVMFIDSGNPATSRLMWYFDSYSGLPVTPNGADINVTFPSGTNKIWAAV